MIKGQVYKYLKEYFSEYLFGFDKSNLEVALLSGSSPSLLGQIELKDVNLRPDKINNIINFSHLPIGLKAGMMRRLNLKYSILSWSSSPFELTIDDLQLIVGPSMNGISNDDSFLQDEDAGLPYDQSNCFNIFTHNIKVAKKGKAKVTVEPTESDEKSTEAETFLCGIVSNMTLVVKNLHIRYEDDYFAGTLPFAFGLICNEVTSYIVNNEWKFPSIESFKFTRTIPRDGDKLRIRETNIKDVRVYWKSPAEMVVPISLYEFTKDAENQIFEAISLEDMRNMMKQSFAEDNLIEKFSLYLSLAKNNRETAVEEAQKEIRFKSKVDLLFTKVAVNITPRILENIKMLREYASNFLIVHDLKNYRPKQRPIATLEAIAKSEALLGREKSRRKRLLIVRDWFFFAVWANRIKVLIKKYSNESCKEATKPKQNFCSRLRQKSSFHDSMKMSRIPSVEEYMAEIEQRIEKGESCVQLFKAKLTKLLCNAKVGVRMQELTVNFYSNCTSTIVLNNAKKPLFELVITVSFFANL